MAVNIKFRNRHESKTLPDARVPYVDLGVAPIISFDVREAKAGTTKPTVHVLVSGEDMTMSYEMSLDEFMVSAATMSTGAGHKWGYKNLQRVTDLMPSDPEERIRILNELVKEVVLKLEEEIRGNTNNDTSS